PCCAPGAGWVPGAVGWTGGAPVAPVAGPAVAPITLPTTGGHDSVGWSPAGSPAWKIPGPEPLDPDGSTGRGKVGPGFGEGGWAWLVVVVGGAGVAGTTTTTGTTGGGTSLTTGRAGTWGVAAGGGDIAGANGVTEAMGDIAPWLGPAAP